MKSIAIRLVASLVITALGCAGEHRGNTFTEPPPPPAAPTLTTLAVILPVPTLLAGQTMTATATAVDQYGAAIATGAALGTAIAGTAMTVVTGVVGFFLGLIFLICAFFALRRA